MRRLLRWAFHLAAAVSALLFVGMCVLWGMSYTTASPASEYHGTYASGEWVLGVRRGEVSGRALPYAMGSVVATDVGGVTVPVGGPVPVIENWIPPAQSDLHRPFPGVCSSQQFYSIPMSAGPPTKQVISWGFAVRLWLPCLLFALLPALRGVQWRGGRRSPGPLPILRLRPPRHANRCPECGRAPRQARLRQTDLLPYIEFCR